MESPFDQMTVTPSGCWLFTGYVCRHTGYGHVGYGRKRVGAHRLAFFKANGRWPKFACHTCDTKSCINPAHMYDGDARSNMIDAIVRGQYKPPPERLVCPKGHPKEVRNIHGYLICAQCGREATRKSYLKRKYGS